MSSTQGTNFSETRQRKLDTGVLHKLVQEFKVNGLEKKVTTEMLASLKIIEEHLELFANFVHEQIFDAAKRQAGGLSKALEELPDLDKVLWPKVKEVYEQASGQELEIVTPVVERPTETAVSFFADQRTWQGIRDASFTDKLRNLAGKSYLKIWLSLLAFQGVAREIPQSQVVKLPAVAARETVVPEGQRIIEDLVKINKERTVNSEIAGVNFSAEDETEIKSEFEKFVDTLSSTTSFSREKLEGQIIDSIRKDALSWNIPGALESQDSLLEDQQEFYAKLIGERVWRAVEVISGQSNELGTIELSEREVSARKTGDKTPQFYKFSIVEQQQMIKDWFELNKQRLANSSESKVINLGEFIEQQPERIGIFAKDLNETMPFGFGFYTSGFRSVEDQIKQIEKYAAAANIDLSEFDLNEAEDAAEVCSKLREKNIFVSVPGSSMHQKERAIDWAPASQFGMVFGDITKAVRLGVEGKLRIIVEDKNGSVGVLHFEATNKYIDGLVDQSNDLKTVTSTNAAK